MFGGAGASGGWRRRTWTRQAKSSRGSFRTRKPKVRLRGGTIHVVGGLTCSNESTNQLNATLLWTPLIWAPQWWDAQYQSTLEVPDNNYEGNYDPTFIGSSRLELRLWATNQLPDVPPIQLLVPYFFALRVASTQDVDPNLPGNPANLFCSGPRNLFLRDWGHQEFFPGVTDNPDYTTPAGPTPNDRVVHREFGLVQFGSELAGAGNTFDLPRHRFRLPKIRLGSQQALCLDFGCYCTIAETFQPVFGWQLHGTFGYAHRSRAP